MLARSLVALFAVSIPLTMFPLGAQAQSSIDLKTTSTPPIARGPEKGSLSSRSRW